MKRNVTPAELRQSLDVGRTLTILDVRKKADYDADTVMLPQALWREPERVADWSVSLPASTPVVVYCVHGHAVSQGVADYLRARGFDACYLEGGVEGWEAIGAPVVQKHSMA